LDRISREAKEKGISLTLTTQGDYQFVAMNGDELHTEESFDVLSKKEQEQFSDAIDELEVRLRSMVRELTEWEETYSDKIKKLNDEVTLDVITHFTKKLKVDYAQYSEIKTYLTELQKDNVENADIFLD
ncbi:AAA family ATPase, partial [Vibrio parahaemolyticus]|nr:AAA family ATPase [Vibrio parahaemolyticus]